MPPSPSLRRSPSMEPRTDSHKRGCSLESGLSFKDKDDDLALFNEMQSREEENFLLQPTDDFEDIFSSRVKPFPDLRLGINKPARGESSDLLNLEGDKNDYEWLLTPPDTPLFPSLDDEPPPVNLVHNGRARSRPITISRSSTMEKRSSRGSPSPQRLSPSPRSGSNTFKGRPSSAPHTTPAPLRSGTPSRRPSPPPVKPSTPPPRTSTPPPRRTNAGSSPSVVTSGLRGTSPVRTSRGNSASPKIMAWQSNIPGFSLEAPPNLRTSLADRPASYVRGSSPASKGSSSSSKFRRQSMSPTASRSISSSHSQERDRMSSHSKGSVVSSVDDDADSLQSIPMSVTEPPLSRKGVSGISNGRPLASSKKPTKTISPSSAPKRSFDSAMRQMDRKSPQNMFRPLLSSVPSSTFYAGKSSAAHRAMISRNSSVTTSSNASSELAISYAHDSEGSDLYQDDMVSESARVPFSDIQDEVFAIDEMDMASQGIGMETHDTLPGKPEKSDDSKESDIYLRSISTFATSEAINLQGNFVEIDSHEERLLCVVCGSRYLADKVEESEISICPQCKRTGELLMSTSDELKNPEEEPRMQNCLDSCLAMSAREETIQLGDEHKTVYNPSNASNGLAETNKGDNKSDSNIDLTEGQGISVLLLKRSGSHKGPLIHSRTFNSSAISYDDLSYARDLTSSVRSSVGHGSISTSSSVDLASVGHVGGVMQRQLSGRRSDTSSKLQRSLSSFSGNSVPVSQGFGLSTNSHEETHEESFNNMQQAVIEEMNGLPSGRALNLYSELQNSVPCVSGASAPEEASREKDASLMDGCTENANLGNVQVSINMDEGHDVCEINEDAEKRVGSFQNVEESAFLESSVTEESRMPDDRADEIEVAEDSLHDSLPTSSEVMNDESHPCSPRSKVDLVSREDLEDPSATEHLKGSSLEPSELDHANVDENSIVTMEQQDQGGRRTRSLTLEEATDTILFCSSIVHDLAYKAASIAIEKEKENLEPVEICRPTVTIPEKLSSERWEPRASPGRKKTQKKARKPSEETEPKSPLTKHNEKTDEYAIRNVGLPNNGDNMKPPKLESKCNCTVM